MSPQGQPMAMGSAKVDYERSLCNALTPNSRVVNPVTGQVTEESTIGWFSATDNFNIDAGVLTVFYPLGVVYSALDSYNIPNEILASEADYGWPNYQSEDERRSLSENYPDEMEYGGDIDFDEFLKDFEKMLKYGKKNVEKKTKDNKNYNWGFKI